MTERTTAVANRMSEAVGLVLWFLLTKVAPVTCPTHHNQALIKITGNITDFP